MINGIRGADMSYMIVWFLSFRLPEGTGKIKTKSYPVNPVDPVWLSILIY